MVRRKNLTSSSSVKSVPCAVYAKKKLSISFQDLHLRPQKLLTGLFRIGALSKRKKTSYAVYVWSGRGMVVDIYRNV